MGKLTKTEIMEIGKERNKNLKIISIEEVITKNNRHRWLISYECLECKYNGKCYWDNFKRQGCPECRKNKVSDLCKKYSDDEINKRLNEDGFELIDRNYSRSSCLVKCLKCGKTNARSTSVIMNEHRKCSVCDGKVITTNDFKEIVKDIGDDEYEVISDYINSKSKINIKHKICNHEYWVTPDNFRRGRRCPYCNESKGEKFISDILSNNNIEFYKEYYFDDLYGDYKHLRFDFAIFKENELYCLVEYDGLFHYEETSLCNNLKRQKRYDELKNDYCEDNNIKLIRIPYWEFDNIEKILIKEGVYKID